MTELGWKLDGGPPSRADTLKLLVAAERMTGASQVVLRCEMPNLETVYVEVCDGRLVVSDRGDTCRYLEHGDDAHRVVGAEEIRQVCTRHGMCLVEPEDMWPHITPPADAQLSVEDAVAGVAEAVDAVFAMALN